MFRQLFTFIFAVLAIIVGFVSLTVVSIRYRALEDTTYTSVLSKNAIYQLTADAILESSEGYFAQAADPEDPSEEVTNDFGPKLSQALLETLLANIDLEATLRTTIDNNLRNLSDWINGRSEELILFLPKEEILAGFGDDPNATFVETFLETALEGIPLCQPGQAAPNLDNPDELVSITCYTEEFKEQLRVRITDQFTGSNEAGDIGDSVFESFFGDLQSETRLADFVSSTGEKDAQSVVNQLNNVRAKVQLVTLYGWLAVTLFLVLTMLATLISRNPIGVFAKTMMITGALLLFTSALFRYVLWPVVIVERLNPDFSSVPTIVLSEQQLDVLTKTVLIDLGVELTSYMFMAGLFMFVAFNALWILTILLARKKKKKLTPPFTTETDANA